MSRTGRPLERAPRPPAALIAPAFLALVFVALPLAGLLAGTPWSALGRLLTRPDVLSALWLSVECTFGALAVSTVLGVPLAFLFARTRFPGKALVRALVTLPLVLPPVAGGVRVQVHGNP